MKRAIFLAAWIAYGAVFKVDCALSEIVPAGLFSDHMVIQRDVPTKVWGTAAPGEVIEVTLASSVASTTADATGQWQTQLDASAAGGPHTLTLTGNNKLEFTDVMIGEVWICSGQSNMHWTLAPERGVVNNTAEVSAANYPNIRMLTVVKALAERPAATIKGPWLPVTPENVLVGGPDGMSAVAYFFGRELHRQLKLPIGLVHASLGGTRIEAWSPGGELYNGMICPLGRFAARGVIWYQGEENCIAKDGMKYFSKQRTLIEAWRKLWGHDDFSFYFAQLAPFRYSTDYTGDAYELPRLWEAQVATLSIPHTGMVVTTDLVDNLDDCHPRNKQDVGRRFALWALHSDYGHSDLVCSGPLYKSMALQNNAIRLTFDSVGGGLTTRDGKDPDWFEVAGTDNKFVPAAARIDGDAVIVSAADVPAPKKVRFGWSELAEPNLINREGLPASPFRTSN